MANSKYFERTLTNKNEIYSAWWGAEVLGGGTILFILKIST